MIDFIDHITNYASLLKSGSVWHDSTEVLAPVLGDDDNDPAMNDYIYEFYCYLSVIVDLKTNYELKFVEGDGEYKFNFPRKAAPKKGKPLFHAFESGKLAFQICAGTMINCDYQREKNHPDISFQLADASDDPTEEDLIIIMDAKFTENHKSRLSKTEFYKFGGITDVFDLRGKPKTIIKFNKLADMFGNCLITNGRAYADPTDLKLSKRWAIKEVEHFSPGNRKISVIG
ncbi:hypothetical protein FHW88_005199 [Mucilaginibacter sp. SG538B]|uniref:hypothetical protein n=1 Tax=Mucilaginibacter sp. SG538B TaxID=2587021 RepID=UPI00159D663A|nr:hypothetical protein [Mucilaginibacter sp. SG538B]NVM66881.1 hypothetical protein [Mucilaginibacter sp. SG538B]